MIGQLIQEFRQLQIEVTELKAAGQRVEEVNDEDGAIRYQLYFMEGCEQKAKQLLADGVAAFLEKNDQVWRTKSCTVSVIKPVADEAGWGAIRLEIRVISVSGLIRLRKVVKKQVEAVNLPTHSLRTRKPVATSKLYSREADAIWQSSLRDAIMYLRAEP